jgi:hypothetical protein
VGAVARRRSSRGAACGEFQGAGSCIIGPQPVLRAPWPGASPPLRRHVRPRFLHMDLIAEPRRWRQVRQRAGQRARLGPT